jgi:hypothetical protein
MGKQKRRHQDGPKARLAANRRFTIASCALVKNRFVLARWRM